MRLCLPAVLGLTLALGAVPAAAQQGPSFDCAKAGTKVEKAICADDYLATFDRELAALYKVVRDSLDAPSQDELKAAQRAWLKDERNLCEKAKATADTTAEGAIWTCLYAAYELRLGELGQMLEMLADDTPADETWSGSYEYNDGYSAGTLLLLRKAEGFAFQLSSVTGPSYHTCDLSGEQMDLGPDLLLWQGEDDCRVTITRTADGVAVSSAGCHDWCGANGYFDADYVAQ